jgi:hypothetical protein
MNTWQKGNVSESMVTARLLESGYNVLIPVGSGHRYDIVIEKYSKFFRVQIKTGRVLNGVISFNTCSNNKGYKRRSYHNDADYIGVYCQALNECYLVPVSLTGRSQMTLRIDVPKNNQSKNIQYKDSFLII